MKGIKISIIAVGTLTSITTITGAVMGPSRVSADDVVSTATITVPVACTMSGTGTDSHTATIPNGTVQENIGTTTMKVYCNDSEGFSIYAAGFSEDTLGNTFLRDATLGASDDILTGTTFTGTSQWAMKIGATTGTYPSTIAGSAGDSEAGAGDTDYSTWAEIPSSYTRIAYRNSGTDVNNESAASAEGSSITATYKAFINSTQKAGTYVGKVKFTMVHPADGTAPVIPSETSCTTPVPNLTYMQDLNSSNKASILAGMTEDAQYFLKDKRDEKSYCVAKLKDGNIWMTQNLDLDITTQGAYNATTNTYTPFTNQNTDIGWNSNTGSYDTASWTPDKATYVTNDTTWTTGSAGYTIQESYDPGDLYPSTDAINGWKYYYSCDAGSCDTTIYAELNSEWKAYFDSCDTGTIYNCDDSLMPTNNTSSDGIDQYHLGNYYNWTAAVAMNDSSSYTTDNTDVDQSICPANWTLAKGGNNTSNGSFYYPLNQYGTLNSETGYMDNGYNPTETPIYLAPSGGWYGSLEGVGDYGDFWSSVVRDSRRACVYGANVVGGVNPGIYYDSRNGGYSVRCLAR